MAQEANEEAQEEEEKDEGPFQVSDCPRLSHPAIVWRPAQQIIGRPMQRLTTQVIDKRYGRLALRLAVFPSSATGPRRHHRQRTTQGGCSPQSTERETEMVVTLVHIKDFGERNEQDAFDEW